ncbi:hypothetical protein IKS57_05970 [bacterium]|nr:hypothetical protein [bacterium]
MNYKFFEHEDYSEKIINNKQFPIYKILIKNNINPKDVSSLIHAKNPEKFPK